ncbi:MAG: type VI secretion system baseplate subunit TssK [Proteobacteria bacterium]|nr:type VI secretion system baseplate subunit TssK [Pseudomonadota bacterium]
MSRSSAVVWSQGMFLQPHHFQQEARHTAHLVDMRARAAAAHAWGCFELVLDEGALALGRVGLVRAAGILPDGTPFSLPDRDELPAPLAIPIDIKDEVVYLALPLSRSDATEVAFDGAADADGCRYRAVTEELRDQTSAHDDPEPVQTADLRLRLVRQRDALATDALLGIARVQELRNDRQVVLDRSYIAPQVRIDATDQLSASAGLLHGLIRQRARLLAERMGQQLGHGISELGEFLTLQVLNRADALFRQLAGSGTTHPLTLYLACVQLAGELASFAGEQRQSPEYPLYRHDDLSSCHWKIVDELRRLLSAAVHRHALRIELVDHGRGVYSATTPDPDLPRSANFVLAVNAQVPGDQLRTRFPAQAKLGPVERIRDLVNHHLPGIGLRSLPVAPRQLPFHAGHQYYEVERGGDLWRQFESTGSLALHVVGDFPGLDLELWAILS